MKWYKVLPPDPPAAVETKKMAKEEQSWANVAIGEVYHQTRQSTNSKWALGGGRKQNYPRLIVPNVRSFGTAVGIAAVAEIVIGEAVAIENPVGSDRCEYVGDKKNVYWNVGFAVARVLAEEAGGTGNACSVGVECGEYNGTAARN